MASMRAPAVAGSFYPADRLELAADTLTITGTANMTNFCPANSTTSTVVGSTNGSVKLVA